MFDKLRKRVAHGLNWRWRSVVGRYWLLFAEIITEVRWRARGSGRPHGLKSKLICSLTSYPPRFPTLEKTLKCLLTQSIAIDRTILWIAPADEALLPQSVKALTRAGLEIKLTEDIGSYKKIIPALKSFVDDFILIADDDVYYEYDWAKNIVSAYDGNKIIPCHRAHQITFDSSGKIAPYANWITELSSAIASPRVMATGVGGVLYPPKCFVDQVLDVGTLKSICANGDDIWLYWMARLNGFQFKSTGVKRRLIPWDGSQESALYNSNWAYGNDAKIKAMAERYGWPASLD